MPPLAENIGPIGCRKRTVLAATLLVLALLGAAALVVGGAPRGARVVLFVPFWLAALGFLQARGHT